jgi:protein gp37
MSAQTTIEWTDATWNPVTGCTEVSLGCDHCYAKTFAERWRGTPGHYFERGFDVQLRPDKLALPLTWKKPRRIFVNSMSDLFHDSVPDEYIAKVFVVMALTPHHTFQLLTKRHARMRSLLNSPRWRDLLCEADSWSCGLDLPYSTERFLAVRSWIYGNGDWSKPVAPLPNVWLGVSVENQQWADIRIPALLDTPAAVRWISTEPLLGPVDLDGPIINGHRPRLTYWLTGRPGWGPDETTPTGLTVQGLTTGPRIDWVVAGGESGPGARPMAPTWVRSLRDQCRSADVPFLFKQWGAHVPRCTLALCGTPCSCAGSNPTHPFEMRRVSKHAAGRELDGRTHDSYPVRAA